MQLAETARDAPSITFDLTTRVTMDGRTAIRLHLFRDGLPVLTKAIATVEHGDAMPVLLRCRRDLERRGILRQKGKSLPPLPRTRRMAALA